jgi:hypothetical protein
MKKIVLLVSFVLAVMLAACSTAVVTTAAPVVVATTAPAGPVALTVTGKVAEVENFTMADLKAMNVITAAVTHPKNGDISVTGVLLKDVLAKAQPAADATKITFVGSDGYTIDLDLAPVLACANCMIGFADDGSLTTAMPTFPGNAWAKLLVSIEIK